MNSTTKPMENTANKYQNKVSEILIETQMGDNGRIPFGFGTMMEILLSQNN